MPKLIITERGRQEEWIHECKEDALSIGRHDENIISLPSQGVSRSHAQVIREGEHYFIVDKESGNGTYLNGMRLDPNERYLLRNRDHITIDTFDLTFYTTDELLEKSYNEEITDSDILEVKLLKKVLGALDQETAPSFEVLNGSAEGTKFCFTDDVDELIIGRDPDVGFSINEHVISRQHAKIIKRWGGIAIRDLESKNGTFINNRRVAEEYLHDGDRIALGTIVLMFRNPQEINLAQFAEKIPPKHAPAEVAPDSIPEAEGAAAKPKDRDEEEEQRAADSLRQEPEQEFERLEDERDRAKAPYPVAPAPKKPRFSPIEIGMIGLGALVFIFALITVVNLLMA
jgi:pSer/pThr/pTyr-binding forkhead associated (FHA) protein